MGFEKHHGKPVHKGQKLQCPHCEHKATQKGHLQTHIKSVHEGQKFQCPQCEYKATRKGDLKQHKKLVHEGQCIKCDYKAKNKALLHKHVKSVHGKVKSELKTEYLSDKVDIAMEEYFETDVKYEDDFDMEPESKELKHEFISDSSDKEGYDRIL